MAVSLDRLEPTPSTTGKVGADDSIVRAFFSQCARLRAFVRSQISDATEVEDILQEVFYELIVAYRLMQPGWLLRVARNRIIDRFRARASERRVIAHKRAAR